MTTINISNEYLNQPIYNKNVDCTKINLSNESMGHVKQINASLGVLEALVSNSNAESNQSLDTDNIQNPQHIITHHQDEYKNVLDELNQHATNLLSTLPIEFQLQYQSGMIAGQNISSYSDVGSLKDILSSMGSSNVLAVILAVMIGAVTNQSDVVRTQGEIIASGQDRVKYLNNVQAALDQYKNILPVMDNETPPQEIKSMSQLFEDVFGTNDPTKGVPASQIASLQATLSPLKNLIGGYTSGTTPANFANQISGFFNNFNNALTSVGTDPSSLFPVINGDVQNDSGVAEGATTAAKNGVAAASSVSQQDSMYFQSDSQSLTAFITMANFIVQKIGDNNSTALRFS